jgi:hypothetical protein
MGSIYSLSSSSLQPDFSAALQRPSLSAGTNLSNPNTALDEGQLTPVALMISTLRGLQQSNPGEYKQLAQLVAANLHSAASNAQAEGNTAVAGQLNQLAANFQNDSINEQVPEVQNPAQGAGGPPHHHHHHSHSAAADPTANGTENSSLDPLAIISNTLSSDGVGG